MKRDDYETRYSDDTLVAWHEAGHAIWALRTGRTNVSIEHCTKDGMPYVKARCLIHPELTTFTQDHLEFLLSGLAGEKVYCSTSDRDFNELSVEWYQALDCSWGMLAHIGAVSYKDFRDYTSLERYCEAVPVVCNNQVRAVFEDLFERAKIDRALPRIAQLATFRKNVTADQINRIWIKSI